MSSRATSHVAGGFVIYIPGKSGGCYSGKSGENVVAIRASEPDPGRFLGHSQPARWEH